MITAFTPVCAKVLQQLQGLPNYKAAWRQLDTIRTSSAAKELIVRHLATYWAVPVEEVIDAISTKRRIGYSL
jgi:energy-converting hydrogenase A subunit M